MKHLACFCVSGMVQLILCIRGCYRKLCLSRMEARGEAGSWRLLGAEDWGIGAGSWEKRGKRSWLSRRGAAGVALLSTQTITRSAGERRRIVTLRLHSVTADLQVSLPVFWLHPDPGCFRMADGKAVIHWTNKTDRWVILHRRSTENKPGRF